MIVPQSAADRQALRARPWLSVRWQLLGFFALSMLVVLVLCVAWTVQLGRVSAKIEALQQQGDQTERGFGFAREALLGERLAWSELLLRGRAQSEYHSLLSRYYAAERESRGQLSRLRERLQSAAGIETEVQDLVATHLDTGRKRREALRTFNDSSAEAALLAEQLTRGVEPQALAALDRLHKRHLQLEEAQRAELQHVEQQQRLWFLSGIGGFGLLAALSFIWIVDRKIGRPAQRSLELAALVEQAEGIAQFGVWDWHSETNEYFWSSGVYRMFDLDSSARPSLELLHKLVPESEYRTLMAALRNQQAGDPVTQLRLHVNKSGGAHSMLCYLQAAAGRDGSNVVQSGIFVDVTERDLQQHELERLNLVLESRVEQRTAELSQANAQLLSTVQHLEDTQRELVQREKLAALGRLVAGVAHELNTPIGNAYTLASTLNDVAVEFQASATRGAVSRKAFEDFVEHVTTGSKLVLGSLHRASKLISEFKEVAVDQTSERRRIFNLGQVVSEVVASMRSQYRYAGVQISIDIDAAIEMDSLPGPLGQIIGNLVMNALLHGLAEQRDTGRIAIEARLRDAHAVRLSVSDNGCGIAPDVLPRIFDPFFTTRMGQGGSGLGLSIVHNITSGVLGGSISVDSQPGSGTRFVLELPLVAPPSSGEAAA